MVSVQEGPGAFDSNRRAFPVLDVPKDAEFDFLGITGERLDANIDNLAVGGARGEPGDVGDVQGIEIARRTATWCRGRVSSRGNT